MMSFSDAHSGVNLHASILLKGVHYYHFSFCAGSPGEGEMCKSRIITPLVAISFVLMFRLYFSWYELVFMYWLWSDHYCHRVYFFCKIKHNYNKRVSSLWKLCSLFVRNFISILKAHIPVRTRPFMFYHSFSRVRFWFYFWKMMNLQFNSATMRVLLLQPPEQIKIKSKIEMCTTVHSTVTCNSIYY